MEDFLTGFSKYLEEQKRKEKKNRLGDAISSAGAAAQRRTAPAQRSAGSNLPALSRRSQVGSLLPPLSEHLRSTSNPVIERDKMLLLIDALESVRKSVSSKNSRSSGGRSLDGTTTENKNWYDGWLDAGGFGKIGNDDDLITGAYETFKTLLATGADIGENVNAAVIDATENLIDNGASLFGNIAGWTGNYDVQDDVMDFIAEDFLKPKETGEFLQRYAFGDILTPLLVGDSNDIENYSVLGDKADNTVQSLSHNIGSRALSLVGVPWQVPTAVNAVGSTLEEAYRNGATWDEGQAAALASAGIEIGTESLFKGSGLGEKGLVNIDWITSGIKNGLAKRLADFGVDVVAENLEEIIAEVAGNAASKIYRDESWEEVMWGDEAKAGYIDALISSMISTGTMNSGKISSSIRNKTDYRTGLTENEQKVFDSIYKERIAEAEKNGKVTRHTKDEIYDKVMSDLKKGYISTEKIEEILSSETYQKYADTTKKRKELQALLAKTDPTGYRNQLDSEMRERLKDSYLAESYKERSRRGEAFKADPSQYKNEFAQKTVKNIVDSGAVNNSNRTHDFVDLLAKISANRGLVFSTADAQKLKDTGYAIQGGTVNGVYDNGTVTLNINSPKALNSVVGHEVVHAMEGSAFYAPLRDAVVAYAKLTGEYDSRLKTIKELYTGKPGYETDFDSKAERELVADLIGDYVFSDPEFVRNLSVSNRNLFQKLYDEIKYLAKVATAGSKEARALEKIKKTFADAYRETKNTAQPDGVKYSVEQQADAEYSKPITIQDASLVRSIKRKSVNEFKEGDVSKAQKWAYKFYSDMQEKSPFFRAWFGDWRKNSEDIVPKVKEREETELKNGKAINRDVGMVISWNAHDIIHETKMHSVKDRISNAAIYQLPEIVENAIYLDSAVSVLSSKSKMDNTAFMHSFYTIYETDTASYVLKLYVEMALNNKGDTIFSRAYQLKDIKKVAVLGNGVSEGNPSLSGANTATIKSISDLFDIVKQFDPDFKPHPSSKVVNSDGTPKVMYHGSPAQFTAFNRNKAKSGGLYGKGFYFTDSPTQAGLYGNLYSVYLNVKHPLQYGDAEVSRDQVRCFLEKVSENEDYSIENYGTYDIDAILDIVIGDGNTVDAFQVIQYISATAIGDMVEAAELFNSVNGTEFDGIIVPTETVVFRSEQIKSANDNIGTFDGSNPDIRYSLSENEMARRGDNVYGSDVAVESREETVPADKRSKVDYSKVAPTKEDIALMEQEKAAQSEDGMQTLIRGLDEIRTQNTRQDPEPETRAKAEKIVSDRNTVISQRAEELYQEISNLKKGVPASKTLGYLLDYGYDWRSVKIALLNIRDNPDQTVNPNSAIESIARDRLNSEYSGGNEPQTGNNVYWQDVAIENLYQIIGESPMDDLQQLPDDKFQMLIRAIEESNTKNTQRNSSPKTLTKAEKIVGDRNTVISQRADKLYQEISNLKKGVRASKDLGYLLNHGYDWRSIKTALLNIRDNPDQVVNTNSAAEQTARKMLSDAYESDLHDAEQRLNYVPAPESIKTVKDRNQAKLHNYTTELVNNIEQRDDVASTYNEKIAQLQEKYDGMKNKTTVSANDLFRQIERTKRLRDNAIAGYEKRISDLYNRIEKMSTEEFKTAQQRQLKQEEYAGWAEKLVGDTSTWVDKKTGWGYMTNTLRRNLRAIVKDANGKPDYKKADAIYEELQGKYNQHEADLNRDLTKLREKYAKLDITKAEDVYIQMLGEFQHNPSTTLTEDTVKGYYEKHKKTIDTAKVDKIIQMARLDYDSLIQRVNEVLRDQGMKEIPYRKGYFPHFVQDKQSWLGKLLNWKTKNDDIPTDIAGMTEQFEPVRSYQSFNKQRKTDITDYSFTKGFDAYSFGAMDWIHHIEDIQKRRALENYIRYVHSEEGVKKKIDAIKANESYDADEAQEQIDLVYKEARNPLNNFVIDLRRGTQTLAGKKSSLDREMEYDTNRKIYSTMTNISNRVSANMVAGSFSAALTNFIPITQSWGTVSPLRSIQAMAQTIKSAIRDDGMVDKSAFLTNRLRQAENLNKTGWDKTSDKISWIMNAVDSFTSQTVWRSKYDTNIAQGMSENEAIHDADLFAESVLAGRSRGNMPTIFDSKNPIVKMLTAFQLEVANQYGYLFQDMPQDAKNKNAAQLVGKYAEVFIGAYAYNALFSVLTGRAAAFDPIRILESLLKDMGVGEDEEDKDELVWSEIFGNFAEDVLQEVPFVGGLLGGGRVPISSALPYENLLETFTGTIKDIENQDTENLTKEWLKPILYVVAPMAGGQVKKTAEGLSMFIGKDTTGSYTTDGKLRFEVEPNAGNVIQAGLFGQWASQNAQDYIDQGRKPLSEEKAEEFEELGISMQEYWAIQDDLGDMDTFEEKAEYIGELDLTTEQKNILINNLSSRKNEIDMEEYEQFGNWPEFDFYMKDPDKYDFLKKHGISYQDWTGFSQTKKDAWTWGYNNPEKLLLSQAVTSNPAAYRRYTSHLNDLKADKNAKGNPIPGSRQKKAYEYINALPLSPEEKMILYKTEFPSYNDDNEEIVEYIKNLDGYSTKEKETMLKELGFTFRNGRVYWD